MSRHGPHSKPVTVLNGLVGKLTGLYVCESGKGGGGHRLGKIWDRFGTEQRGTTKTEKSLRPAKAISPFILYFLLVPEVGIEPTLIKGGF